MTIDLTPTELVAGAGVLFALLITWRSGTRRARTAAHAARTGARVVSLAGRVLLTTAIIVGGQWLVISFVHDQLVVVIVLAVPALFAAHTLTRALTVTTLDTYRRRGQRR
jgi:hypothetical protein